MYPVQVSSRQSMKTVGSARQIWNYYCQNWEYTKYIPVSGWTIIGFTFGESQMSPWESEELKAECRIN